MAELEKLGQKYRVALSFWVYTLQRILDLRKYSVLTEGLVLMTALLKELLSLIDRIVPYWAAILARYRFERIGTLVLCGTFVGVTYLIILKVHEKI